MKKIKIFQVDAFTKVAFGGNPAGVVPNAGGLSEEEMQRIAREMNCSETAFVMESENPNADFRIRFFTPAEEVDLCGHATIAACHVLVHQGIIAASVGETVINQETRAGVLPVHIYCDDQHVVSSVVMGQRLPVFLETITDKNAVAALMGLDAADLELNGLPLQIVSTGLPDLMVPVKNLAALKAAAPNFEKMAQYQRDHDFISFHAFTFETENSGNDLSVRDFAPSVQIDEEAATGTANGALGAYLVCNRAFPHRETGNPLVLRIEQGVGMGRPSQIIVEIGHEGEIVTNVRVGGSAVIVLEGLMGF
jgi:trans-2,3-dihydro-3-hydroxyanthranilate isomerase